MFWIAHSGRELAALIRAFPEDIPPRHVLAPTVLTQTRSAILCDLVRNASPSPGFRGASQKYENICKEFALPGHNNGKRRGGLEAITRLLNGEFWLRIVTSLMHM
jgi:hypothetical protein